MTVEEFYNQEANKKPFTESAFKNTKGVTWKDGKPQQNVIHATDEMLAFAEAYHKMKMNESDGTGLTPANKKKMWHIDAQAQVGNDLSNEEVAFFNAHLDLMKIATREEFEHFEYHSGKL